MKTFGRVLLIVTGSLMIIGFVLTLVGCIAALNGFGWNLANAEALTYFLAFLFSFIDLAFGAAALFGGIKGKSSIWLSIFAAIMLIIAIIQIVTNIANGLFASPDAYVILSCIFDFLFPFLYFTGAVLVRKYRN